MPYLFDERHEAVSEAPGLVAVTLERADGDLRRLLDGHSHHMYRVIHQGSICLETHTHTGQSAISGTPEALRR